MPLGQRIRTLVLALVAVSLTGCGIVPGGRPEDPPDPLPADQLVFSLEGWGGLVPPFIDALTTPGVVLYGDGRLVTLDQSSTAQAVPFGYQIAQADAREVAAFVARAEATDLVNDRTDFGSPSVTDMPVTTVLLHGRTGPQRASIYAFSEDVEDDLGWGQRRARSDLRKIIDEALALPGDALPEPYRPEQTRVIELAHDEGGKPAGADWPGPDPGTFLRPAAAPGSRLGCGTLSGADAERTYAAARTNPNGIWTVDGSTRVLAVVALLPGAAGCTP